MGFGKFSKSGKVAIVLIAMPALRVVYLLLLPLLLLVTSHPTNVRTPPWLWSSLQVKGVKH